MALLHVGDHRLHRLLADLGELPCLVDHAPLLAAHAQRAGLAGVASSHRLPELEQAARLPRLPPCVPNRRPAAACFDFSSSLSRCPWLFVSLMRGAA